MAEAESEGAIRLRSKASEMLQSFSSIALPPSKEPKSSSFLTNSLVEMVNEDPMRLQNQSCVIREEIAKTVDGEQFVYSSLAHLPTFSIGLSSTHGEDSCRDPLCKTSVDPKNKSSPRYFQMPELGARVHVGDGDGFDTIACHLFNGPRHASEFHLDSEYATIRSLYEDDYPGGLNRWLRAQPEEFWKSKDYSEVILRGIELFVDPTNSGFSMVGNLREKSSRVSPSISDYKDCTGDKTVVEQPEDPGPCVYYPWTDDWGSVEGPNLWRSTKGLYLEKPKFTKRVDQLFKSNPSEGDALQLTRFDDFVILGNKYFNGFLRPHKAIDIVRKNASKTVDVIAVQLIKSVIEKHLTSLLYPITAIVIFLDHKTIFQKELKQKKTECMVENILFALETKDKKRIGMEDCHEELLVGKLLPNVPQTSMVSLEENELGMRSTSISSNLTSAKVQDDLEASSSEVLIKDEDCKSDDLKVSRHITKWFIYRDLLERTLLCFFNIEEMQYEFYIEDLESMATITGLGVPHSKVILECGSPHVTIVEILEEDWEVMWASSNVIPHSIPKGNVLKQESFLDILYGIISVINTSYIVSKANDGGTGGDNRTGKDQDNVDDNKGKGKAHDHDNHGNIGHPNGGSSRPLDDNDKKERKEKDGNNDKKDSHVGDDGETSNDCKEVQTVIHLRLLPGGFLEDKKKKKELGEIYEEEVEEKGKGGEVCKGLEKKKKKNIVSSWWHALTRGENGNVVENQEERATTKGVEDVDVDESLLKELENQIHSQMVFTFIYRDEANRPLKTIQATIDPITFQFPPINEDNYLLRRRFGWFHKKLQVAFGVVDSQVANLDAKSCKVLNSSEVEEVNLQGNSKGNARTSINMYKSTIGIKHGVIASGEYDRINGLESKTIDEVQNSWKTNKTLTKGGFSISEHTDLNSQQLKYSYRPLFLFKEKEFEVLDEDDRLTMYESPICQLQRVSCEGTWQPYSESLEAYKLEASRELGMTRIFNLEVETGEEKKKKWVWKVEKNLPLCFIQKLEKVVYLNHAMSHLTSSKTEVYLKEHRDDPFLTQAPDNREPKWPSNCPLVNVEQNMNI